METWECASVDALDPSSSALPDVLALLEPHLLFSAFNRPLDHERALPEPPDYSDPCRYLRQGQAKNQRVCGSGEASGWSEYSMCAFDRGNQKVQLVELITALFGPHKLGVMLKERMKGRLA